MVAARWPSSAYSLPSCFPLLLCPYALVFLQLQFRCLFCVFLSFLLSFFPRFCDFFVWVLLALCFTDFFLFLPPAVHGFFFFPRFCPLFFWFFVPFSVQKSPRCVPVSSVLSPAFCWVPPPFLFSLSFPVSVASHFYEKGGELLVTV